MILPHNGLNRQISIFLINTFWDTNYEIEFGAGIVYIFNSLLYTNIPVVSIRVFTNIACGFVYTVCGFVYTLWNQVALFAKI